MTESGQRWRAPYWASGIGLRAPKAETKGWMGKWLSLGEDSSTETNSQPGEIESASEMSQNCLPKGKKCIYIPFGMQALVNSASWYSQGSLPSRGKKLGKPSGYL